MTARKKNHYIKSLFENHEEMMKLLNFQVLCERWTTSKPPVLRDKMGNRLTSCAMEAKKMSYRFGWLRGYGNALRGALDQDLCGEIISLVHLDSFQGSIVMELLWDFLAEVESAG